MNLPNHPSAATILLLDIGLVSLLLWSLARLGAGRATLAATLSVCIAWLGLVVWIFGGRHVIPEDISGLAFFAVLLGGAATATAMLFASPLAAIFRRGGHPWLLMPQGLRGLFGVTFLIQGVSGTLPPVFATWDGLTHISAAFLALSATWLTAHARFGPRIVWFANLFGLLDIVFVAGGLSFFLLPRIGPYHEIMYAAFFAAPIFIALHLLSLWQLAVERRYGTRSPATPNLSHVPIVQKQF